MKIISFNHRKNRILFDIIVFFIIAISGFPFFSTGYEFTIIFFVFSILIAFHLKYNLFTFNKSEFKILIGFFLLTIAQYFILQQYSLKSFLALLIPLLSCMYAIKIVGTEFLERYVKILYYLSIISLVFYFMFLIFPSSYTFLLNNVAPFFERKSSTRGYSYNSNILIYTLRNNILGFQTFYDYRNSGPFWEPGAMGIYTNLALFIDLFIFGNTLKNKRAIVFILTIITTFSTAAYITLFFIMFVKQLYNKRLKMFLIRIILSIIILYTFSILYKTLPFLSNKIEARMVGFNTAIYVSTKQERIGTFFKDIYYLTKNPIFGYGNDPRNYIENFQGWNIKYTHRNNGVSNLLLILGFPVGLFYLITLSKIIKFNNKRNNERKQNMIYYSFIFFILLGFSQIILLKHIFLSLFWLSIYEK